MGGWTDQGLELDFSGRLGQLDDLDVPLEVEIGVVLPRRAVQLSVEVGQALAVLWEPFTLLVEALDFASAPSDGDERPMG